MVKNYTEIFNMEESGIEGFTNRVVSAATLRKEETKLVHQLYDESYQQANHAYLDKSLSKRNYIALALKGKKLAGFALANTIEATLPRMDEPQIITLAGICCIDAEFRRLGLFSNLEGLAAKASGLRTSAKRILMCGRMAHPASFRGMSKLSTAIPKQGETLTDWQKEVALTVAELYRVSIDPQTLVVKGAGEPIGYPNIDFDLAEEEWLPFQPVNRDRGDSLLGIAWIPDAPENWQQR